MLEKDIERRLTQACKARGWLCLKFESPGYTGVPDRMILLPGGEVVFVELKAPGKKERPRQEYVQKVFRKYGLQVFSSVDSDEAIWRVIGYCLAAEALGRSWQDSYTNEEEEGGGR